MKARRAAAVSAVLVATTLSTSACALLTPMMSGSDGVSSNGGSSCSGWAMASAAPGGVPTGGEATPLAAVLKSPNSSSMPTDGWAPVGNSDTDATYASGAWTVHVHKQSDGTWVADSGQSCGDGAGGAYSSDLKLQPDATPSVATSASAPDAG